jgi:predicted RNase H-like nuclease (RuvC/YqgF family)
MLDWHVEYAKKIGLVPEESEHYQRLLEQFSEEVERNDEFTRQSISLSSPPSTTYEDNHKKVIDKYEKDVDRLEAKNSDLSNEVEKLKYRILVLENKLKNLGESIW